MHDENGKAYPEPTGTAVVSLVEKGIKKRMDKDLIPHVSQGELMQPVDMEQARERIQARLQEMEQNSRRNLRLAVEIGVELLQVKQQSKHGKFGDWLREHFSMSRTEATRYMQLGAYFADKLSNLDNLPPLSVAYLLAQVSTPDTVRQAVLSGEIPQTVEAVKAAITAEKTSETVSPVFDDVSAETAATIKERGQALAKAAIEMGSMLLETVGKGFNVGQMKEWAAAEFGMDDQDVYEFVGHANRYKNTPVSELPQNTLWNIAGTYASWYVDRYKKRPATPPLYEAKKLLASAQDMPEFHEKTRIIPAMQPHEYIGLVQSIKQCGLISPIKTFRGKIIDGRMRYLACRDAGVLPRFEEWTGDESGIISYIASMNLHRTSLNESQQAIIAASLDA
jgi:hypothetical protein